MAMQFAPVFRLERARESCDVVELDEAQNVRAHVARGVQEQMLQQRGARAVAVDAREDMCRPELACDVDGGGWQALGDVSVQLDLERVAPYSRRYHVAGPAHRCRPWVVRPAHEPRERAARIP
jgi:hypothetical protein